MHISHSFRPSWFPFLWKWPLVHLSGSNMGARATSSREWVFGWYVLAMTVDAVSEAHSCTAMLPGGTSQESTQLNIESLWSGGPFQDPVRGTGVC